MAFTKLSKNLGIIQALADEPNQTDGLSADALKAKFDEAALAIQSYINNTLLPELGDEFAQVSDYVVESGAEGYWTWRKWNSGVLECWLRLYADNVLATGNTVNGFTEYAVDATIPVDFYDHRYVTSFTVITGGAGIASGYDATQDRITFRYLDSTNQGWATISAFLRGTWK